MKVLVMNLDLYMKEKKLQKVISTNNFAFRPFLASREEFFKGAILFENNFEYVIKDNLFFQAILNILLQIILMIYDFHL